MSAGLEMNEEAGRETRERAWLARAAAGDRQAFEALYCEYHRRLWRFLARVSNSRELMEEAINDTFWIVWRKAGEFRGDSRVSTWIMGIAYRCALKTLRRDAGSFEPLPDGAAEDGVLPQAQAEQRDWVAKAMLRLPQEQRSTLLLAYYLGHSCEEIAQIMDCSVGTVKARMFHARLKLRNLLPALGGLAPGEDHAAHG
ncbi:MAG: sigma-70 family RNA polymerase sigma factor [Sinobacteraceae bacterium]|nr:sigma-70 family RNA polymerase sigma factor [Nevskiaceae bacterium]